MVDSDKDHSELLKPVFKTSSISKMTRLDSDHMCIGRHCKVSHIKHSTIGKKYDFFKFFFFSKRSQF